MIIKTEDFELEISTETGVYFGSKALGQIFEKWDDLENNKKLGLENIQEKVETLILECKEILSGKDIAIMKHVIIDNSDRRSGVESR